ncbi:hypothetical protein [Carboxylicivirga sp. RSCT41]|uniref:hypothetical protein n=1 Tax=Carboxylicivirga agarovorans TaxID=3417570 RepID=UPI003D333AEB
MTKYPEVDIPRNPVFAHLSDAQFRQMIEDYYSPDFFSTQQLLNKYEVKTVEPSMLMQYFTPLQHHECICPSCKVVSWICIGHETDDRQPFCPVCRQSLRSSINSYAKEMYYDDLLINEMMESKYCIEKQEISYLNKLHV